MRIQAGAQWLMKRAMKRVWGRIKKAWASGMHWEPLLQVHDELVFEYQADLDPLVESTVTACMTADSKSMKVPIKAKFASGADWGVLK